MKKKTKTRLDFQRPIRFFRKEDNQTLVTFNKGLKSKGKKNVPCRFSKEYSFMRNQFKTSGISLVRIRLFYPEIREYPITTSHPLFGELFFKVFYQHELGEEKFGWEYTDE